MNVFYLVLFCIHVCLDDVIKKKNCTYPVYMSISIASLQNICNLIGRKGYNICRLICTLSLDMVPVDNKKETKLQLRYRKK